MLLSILALAVPFQAQAAAVKYVAVTVDGKRVNFDVKPFIDGQNRTIVPIRFIGEEMGYGFGWDENAKEVIVNGNGVFIKLWIGKKEALVNGQKVVLDTTAVLQNGRAMVPLRFILENMGASVQYDSKANVVNVVKKQPETVSEPISDVTEIVQINSPLVNLRSGPGTQYETLKQAKQGDKFLVTSIQGDWYEVAIEGGKKAWVIKKAVEPVDLSKAGKDDSENSADKQLHGKVAVISASIVNVRSGPGTSYSVVSKVTKGDSFDVLAQNGDWYQVALSDNTTGWVAGSLVTLRFTGNLADRSPEPGEGRPDPAVPETPGPKELVNISEIKVDTSGEEITFTVKGDKKLSYSTFNLDNPRRMVFDFFDSILNSNESGSETIPVEKGLVKAIRAAQYTSNQVRVVLDLSGPAGVSLLSSEDNDSKLTFKIGKPSLVGKTIVVDPGHASIQPGGWSDPGAVGPTKLYEKDVVLDIALKVAEKLKAKGAKVILTRTGDTTLTLAGRAEVANSNNADLFVSIHTNANPNRAIGGTATYYYSGIDGQGEVRKKLALAVQKELVNALGRRDIGILEERFAVLRYTKVPSILVETAFISNYEEEKLLADPEFRTKAADGIANGIERYFLD